ncbi:MAG: TSUP family transporter [Nitrospiraceae bacterium]|nr:TSUP family transporter [Nitrospiraceae bacterium]
MFTYIIILIILALSVAIIAPIVGIGGALILVPSLILILNMNPLYAVGLGAVTSAFVAGFSTVFNRKYGSIDKKRGISLGVGAVPGAFLGALMTSWMPVRTIMLFLSLFMLFSSVLILFKMKRKRGISPYLLPVIGLLVGLSAGILGISGGIFYVPVLMLLGMEAKNAVATSSFVVLFKASTAAATHTVLGHVNPYLALVILACALPGTYIGTKLTNIANERYLRYIVSVFLMLMALRLLMISL